MKWFLRISRTPRLMIIAVFLGVVGALGAQVFIWLLDMGNRYILKGIAHVHTIGIHEAHTMKFAPHLGHWMWLVPIATTLGGLISGFIVFTWAPEAEGHGTDAAVKTYHQKAGRMRWRVVPIKTLASAITIGSGGAAGREGPTAQIAAGIGAIAGDLLKLPDDERRYVVLMGMAAGLSAIFKSPLGTAFFAVEILYSSMAFEGAALIYTLVAAAMAYGLTGLFDGWTPLFILPKNVTFGQPLDIWWFAVLGVASGLLGAIFPTIFYRMRDVFRDMKIPNQLKPALGGLILGVIGIFVPQLLGGGYGIMQFALQGGAGMALWLLFLLSIGKVIAMSLTISSGGSGGVFAPTLFVGALLGAAFGSLLHAVGLTGISTPALAVIGMASVFAGAARVPIASMLMIIEMTGGYALIMPAMLAVAVAFLVQEYLTRHARYPTLYEAQLSAPYDSPANLELYRHVIRDFLKNKRVRLENTDLEPIISDLLGEENEIPIFGGREYLAGIKLKPGTTVAGKSVVEIPHEGILIDDIVRGEEHIVPRGTTRLQVGDWLLVAGRSEAIQAFRELAKPASTNNEGAPASTTAPST